MYSIRTCTRLVTRRPVDEVSENTQQNINAVHFSYGSQLTGSHYCRFYGSQFTGRHYCFRWELI